MQEIELSTAERILEGAILNLIRRGTDGSLVLSMDHWRLQSITNAAATFTPEPPAPPTTDPLVIACDQMVRLTWHRLPRQRERSQVRFDLRNGDILTFSGRLRDPDIA
ncbi:MAG: hypothetical protein IT305_17820 [Chloroflexi bacterium]|nr:hypothetical protein [Chloroflexota bacterium]